MLLKCIQLLEDCDPTASPVSDPPELAYFEQMSLAQGPLIDARLFAIDNQLDSLAEVDLSIRNVLAAYDTAVHQLQQQQQQQQISVQQQQQQQPFTTNTTTSNNNNG